MEGDHLGAPAATVTRRGPGTGYSPGGEIPAGEARQTCPLCGREADELHDSAAAGARCCERCHVRASPPTSREARRYRAPEPPAPLQREEGSYPWLVGRVWDRLKEATEMPVFASVDGTGRLWAYCPVCRLGTILVRFIEAPGGPELTITAADGGEPGCTYGCTERQVFEVLAR